MLLSHIRDLAERAEYTPQLSAYLTPAEQRETADALASLGDRLVFWGGIEGADRRRAVFLPEWLRDGARAAYSSHPISARDGIFSAEHEAFAHFAVDMGELGDEFPILRISGSSFAALSHRDYLGAVMNLGLERDTLGDIFTLSDSECVIFCTPLAASAITAELERVGRDAVKVAPADRNDLPSLERKFEEMTLILSSMRLDCAVKALCSLSREAAQRVITSGLCELNYRTADDTAASVAAGDIISVRGTGKFRLISVDGSTRKDRIRLTAVKYI